ncbi:MAG TPA: MATE family efflux transporter [Fimbriimonadaceae bacterium]|nr:MATE family efflux transporter [Fimbriimonadaceae bacterium]HRJ97479.1 MATE family efflux transporter [Fimbriimonadaceae bacterium]
MASLAEPKPLVVAPNERAGRIVWALAWPAVALNSLQVVNTLLDRGFIGHLDPAALTAHGGATNVLFLMFSLAMALGTATTAIVSRAYGAGNNGELREGARQALGVSLFGAVLAMAVCAGLAAVFAAALLPSTDHAARQSMESFLKAYAVGLPAIYLIQVLAGSLRGIGDTKSPMVISGIQIALHIGLNYLFIFPGHDLAGARVPGLGWGLTGAGAALSLSAWVSAIGYLFYASYTPLGAQWRLALPSLAWAKRILRIAIPAALMAILRVGSLAAFTIVLASLPGANGSTAIAAMSTGFAIESMMFMPAFGLSIAAATLVGQSLGMRRPDRAERLGWTAGHYAALVTLLLSIPIFLAAPSIASLLVGNKVEIAREAALLIQILCVTEVLFAYAMTMIGAMQGAGDTIRPMWITIICMWGLRVPLAWVLAFPLGYGSKGAWIAMSVTQAIQGVMAIVLFKQGQWKHKKV